MTYPDEPVVNIILSSPADNGHSVSDMSRSRVDGSHDSRFVVKEGVMMGHNVHCDGSMLLEDRHDGFIRSAQSQTMVRVDVKALVTAHAFLVATFVFL